MKKFYSFLFAAVALVGFAACSTDATEDVVPSTEGGEVVATEFTVSLDETRTQLDGAGKTVWCEDDTICVNGEEFSIKEGTLSADGYTATFSGAVAEAAGYLAVYPYTEGMTVDVANKTVSGVVVPATQALTAGSFAEGAAVAVGYTENNTVSFKNVVSVLKFSVAEACSTVTISSDEYVAGTVTVNYNNGEPTFEVTNGSKTLTLTGDFKTGETYYAAILPGAKANFVVRLDGYFSKKAASVTPVRSKIMNMKELPAGVARILVYDESGWSNLAVYTWNSNDYTRSGPWPGKTKDYTETVNGKEYKVVELDAAAKGETLRMILNNNNNGKQSANSAPFIVKGDAFFRTVSDLDNSPRRIDPANPDAKSAKIYVLNKASWSNVYMHSWYWDGSKDVNITGNWPGKKMTTETLNGTKYYVYDFTTSYSDWRFSYLLHNNSGTQTENLWLDGGLVQDRFYQLNSNKAITELPDPRW